jgi:hypothetical protein
MIKGVWNGNVEYLLSGVLEVVGGVLSGLSNVLGSLFGLNLDIACGGLDLVLFNQQNVS